jgi:hypothetical protein
MSETSPKRPRLDAWGLTFVLTLAAVIVGGLALSYSGVGVRLSAPRTVDVRLRTEPVPNEAAKAVKVGDPVYTEPGGLLIGRITAVKVGPQKMAIGDSAGTLHIRDYTLMSVVELTLTSTGRTGDDLVAISNQAVTVGHRLWIYTDRAFFDTLVVGIDVR